MYNLEEMTDEQLLDKFESVLQSCSSSFDYSQNSERIGFLREAIRNRFESMRETIEEYRAEDYNRSMSNCSC